ncbi:MAG: hypothetical protein ACE5HU_09625, partial [Acidobacteriota bacterium]
MGAVLLWVAIAGLLFWEILALSRPRTISWDEYEKIKGRTQMLQPLLELQNIYSPGMRDLLKAKTEIHEVKEDDG